MQTDIQKKFSRMAKVINFILYFYIFSLVALMIVGVIAFCALTDGNFMLFFSDIVNIIMLAIVAFAVLGYFAIIFFFLISLKNLLISLQDGEIFTEENRNRIKSLFRIFAILLSVLFLVFAGGIFLVFVLVFLWVLYEIFFIGFDYKLKNEKLTEENNLTI